MKHWHLVNLCVQLALIFLSIILNLTFFKDLGELEVIFVWINSIFWQVILTFEFLMLGIHWDRGYMLMETFIKCQVLHILLLCSVFCWFILETTIFLVHLVSKTFYSWICGLRISVEKVVSTFTTKIQKTMFFMVKNELFMTPLSWPLQVR